MHIERMDSGLALLITVEFNYLDRIFMIRSEMNKIFKLLFRTWFNIKKLNINFKTSFISFVINSLGKSIKYQNVQ